ncbi:MAG: FHA domain-containing protein [Myxococcales bacterium]|nr:FHA domain-containing protein [Myxococcales bacterium]
MTRHLRLLATDGPDRGRTWDLGEGDDEAIVGSHIDCVIVLADDAVSGRHAAVRVEGERVVVRDLGSRNGTFYDNVRISERTLGIGDSVRVARTTLRVEPDPEPLDARPSKDGIGVHSDLPYDQARVAVLREFEHRYVVDLLARFRGDVNAAARAAGLTPKHLLALAPEQRLAPRRDED